jgi:hypothetical protein
MSLKGIMSIAGMSGLYKLVAQTKSGFVVESLTDQKRYPISSSQKISMLDDISVFTKGGDMPLKEVLLKMKEHDAEAAKADPKGNPDALKKFFKKVLPDFDEEKVYTSDIKKMVIWYQLVKDLVKEEEPEEKDKDVEVPEPGATPVREHHGHVVADHQKVKASDKKVTSAKTRKKV